MMKSSSAFRILAFTFALLSIGAVVAEATTGSNSSSSSNNTRSRHLRLSRKLSAPTKEPLVGIAEEAPVGAGSPVTKEPLVGIAEEAPVGTDAPPTKEPLVGIAEEAPVGSGSPATKEPKVGIAEEAPVGAGSPPTKEPLVGIAEEAPVGAEAPPTKEPKVGIGAEGPLVLAEGRLTENILDVKTDICEDDNDWLFRGKARKGCDWVGKGGVRSTRIKCLRKSAAESGLQRVYDHCRATCHAVGIKRAR